MSFHLNGTCLAFQDSLFSLDISMGSFFQFPHLVHSFNHKHLCISQPILYPIIILLQKSIIFSKKLVDRIQETRKMVMNTSQKNLIPPSLFSGYRLDRRQVNSNGCHWPSFFLFSDKFREGMTRCESYPPCFGTTYFPTAPISHFTILLSTMNTLVSHTGSSD